jgi:hypothetical protein
MVGRAAAPVCVAPALSAGDLPQAPQKIVPAKTKRAKNRMREAIKSPKFNEFL